MERFVYHEWAMGATKRAGRRPLPEFLCLIPSRPEIIRALVPEVIRGEKNQSANQYVNVALRQ